jgi:hypothetical protein
MRKERLAPRNAPTPLTNVQNVIVKVQKPLTPLDAPWLIYSEHHSIYAFVPASGLPKKVVDATSKGYNKSYWYVSREGTDLIFGDAASYQPW